MERSGAKERILDAAVSLFNGKGYAGTSVREIAKKADLNIALISYYFKGKKGLLEHLMSTFFEEYNEKLEQAYQFTDTRSARQCMHMAIVQLLTYQQDNHQLARFVHRETTLDTMLVREIMTIYLRKEKFCWNKLIEKGVEKGEFKRQATDFTIMQLKGMIIMPFMNPQYLQEIFQLSPSDAHFNKRYAAYLTNWVDQHICHPSKEISEKGTPLYRFTAVP